MVTTRTPLLGHEPMQAHVRHHRDGDHVDLAVERQHGDDLIAVDDVAVPVDGQHAVAVTVEGDTEVEPDAR